MSLLPKVNLDEVVACYYLTFDNEIKFCGGALPKFAIVYPDHLSFILEYYAISICIRCTNGKIYWKRKNERDQKLEELTEKERAELEFQILKYMR